MALMFDRTVASVLNLVWGIIFTIVAILIICLDKIDNKITAHHPFDLIFILAPVGIYSMICGFGIIAFTVVRCKQPTYKEVLYLGEHLFRKEFFLYPLLFLLSPLVCLVVRLRGICRHNAFYRRELMEYKFIECFIETSTQLCLQSFIIMKDLGSQPVTPTQILSVTLGVLTVSIPSLDKFLSSIRPYSFTNYLKFYPIFFCNVLFRIFTWSVIFYFFYFFYGCVILFCHLLLVALLNYLVMKKYFPELMNEEEDREEYKYQVGVMAVQTFLTIPNLENNKASRFCRKFSFYGSLIFNSSVLFTLLMMSNLGANFHLSCRPVFESETEQCLHAPFQDTLVTEIMNLNLIISSILLLGVLSLILDLIYARHLTAVFNIPIVNHVNYADNFSKLLNNPVPVCDVCESAL